MNSLLPRVNSQILLSSKQRLEAKLQKLQSDMMMMRIHHRYEELERVEIEVDKIHMQLRSLS